MVSSHIYWNCDNLRKPKKLPLLKLLNDMLHTHLHGMCRSIDHYQNIDMYISKLHYKQLHSMYCTTPNRLT